MDAPRWNGLTIALTIAVAALAIVAGISFYRPPPSPGSVTLDGVLVSTDYATNSSRQAFGPAQNVSCPECPLTLSGGQQASVFVLWINLIGYPAVVYYNASIWSPIPFREDGCSGLGPCPLTNDEIFRNVTFTAGGGGGLFAVPALLTVPDPAPSLPGGFWILSVVQANVVPMESGSTIT
jgi:hypothetical protein